MGFFCVDFLHVGLVLRLTIKVHHAGFAEVFLAGWFLVAHAGFAEVFLAGWFLVAGVFLFDTLMHEGQFLVDLNNVLHADMFFVLLVSFSNVLLAGLSNVFLAAFSTEKNFRL